MSFSNGFCFNPRSREGSDSSGSWRRETGPVSIHAPARGATVGSLDDAKELVFQSTLPRGERLLPSFEAFPWHSFNPRSREGSDRRRGFSRR